MPYHHSYFHPAQDIVFFEEGEPMIDGEPGDLKFRVRTRQNRRFQRAGNDLRHNLTISLIDALTGFSTEVCSAENTPIPEHLC
jgi:DnaJ family protein B protein 11